MDTLKRPADGKEAPAKRPKNAEESGDEDDKDDEFKMDKGMLAARKADKKERKWAQTSLKKAVRGKDVKFMNKLISEFGNAKQLGFSFQVSKLCGMP
jgi:hypothetical protein